MVCDLFKDYCSQRILRASCDEKSQDFHLISSLRIPQGRAIAFPEPPVSVVFRSHLYLSDDSGISRDFAEIHGYEVFWDDGIAEELSYEEWKKRLIREKPDIVAIETKTPVVKKHWEIIDELKSSTLRVSLSHFVLMGDHVYRSSRRISSKFQSRFCSLRRGL